MSQSDQNKGTPKSAEQKYRTRRGIAIGIFIFFIVLIGAAGIIAVKVLSDVNDTMNKVYQDVDTIDMRNSDVPGETEGEEIDGRKNEKGSGKITTEDLMKDAKPIAILLIGADTGDLGRTSTNGLSDTLIYCVLNPNTQKLTMLSIPRDTYTEIVGRGTRAKINSAYSYGGASMCINTVQNLLGLPIDAYAAVNFYGFQQIINAIGGITVENEFAFSQDEYYFPEGTLTLNGAEALAYCRMRYQDPEGDFGRSRRQRDVVSIAAKKILSMSGALNYNELLKAIGDNLLTNISMDTALDLMDQYGSCLNNIESMDTLKGTSNNDNGWIYILDQQNLAEVSAHLREELELD